MTSGRARVASIAAATLVVAAAIATAEARRRPRRPPSPGPAAEPATTVDLGPAHVLVDDGWTVEATPTDTTTGVLRREGAVMIVTRQAAPNPQAWSSATRDAHVAELIAGFTAGGATELDRKLTTEAASQTPVLDLTLERGGHVVAVRVILFRTLTVAAAATADDAADRRLALRAVRGLHPDR